jgi:hypothetical protein
MAHCPFIVIIVTAKLHGTPIEKEICSLRDTSGCSARHFSPLHRIVFTMTTTVASAATKAPKKSGYDVPWVERYRPETLDDVVGNEDTLVRLRAIAKDGNMPNIILCGLPGTGKVCVVGHVCTCIYTTRNDD